MAASTQQVLDHHLQAFGTGDLDATLEDYADGSIIIGPDGVRRTRKEWSHFFSTLFAEFAKSLHHPRSRCLDTWLLEFRHVAVDQQLRRPLP